MFLVQGTVFLFIICSLITHRQLVTQVVSKEYQRQDQATNKEEESINRVFSFSFVFALFVQGRFSYFQSKQPLKRVVALLGGTLSRLHIVYVYQTFMCTAQLHSIALWH